MSGVEGSEPRAIIAGRTLDTGMNCLPSDYMLAPQALSLLKRRHAQATGYSCSTLLAFILFDEACSQRINLTGQCKLELVPLAVTVLVVNSYLTDQLWKSVVI